MQRWPAPAKLNLFLHILGRRADGYHELQTAFQFLDYGDEMEFSVNASGEVSLKQPLAGIDVDKELSTRAARLLQRHCGCRNGVDISLIKHLPVGGGLGGGSSDAATTLIALNRLWGLRLSRAELMKIGVQIGADVPVFIYGHAAWAEGIGEQLRDISPAECWYLVICPRISVSTAAIFNDPELTRDSPAITIRAFQQGATRNDLQALVCQRFSQVQEVIVWLGAYGEPRMTGSGACVFLPVADQAAGERILAQVPAGNDGFVAKGLNRHPLYDVMN